MTTVAPRQNAPLAPPVRLPQAHVERPLSIRLLISVMKFSEWLGLPKTRLEPDRLLEQVRRQTGLEWDDRRFEEPLRVLADSVNREARLHPLGNKLMASSMTLFLRNRLWLESAWRSQPEVLQSPVRQPLYVIGLPRTGTTLLYNLLCQDPNGRPLMGWETFSPAPPPATQRGWLYRDRRQQQGRKLVWGLNWMAPKLKSVHELTAQGPEECTWLLHNSFLSPSFLLQADLPTYSAYLQSRPRDDWRRIYNDYAKTLQLLQQGTSATHWVLKSPAHQAGLAGLLDVIPNACVIQTHRDPKQVIASCCSLFSVVRGIYSDQVHDKTLGSEVIENLRFAVSRAMEARDERPERFFDVRFDQLVKDPIGTVRRIYERFQYPFDPRMEVGMKRWLVENPQGKHGKHQYDLGQFGLTEAQVQTAFGEYQRQFEGLTR